jgi:hypothetical protein
VWLDEHSDTDKEGNPVSRRIGHPMWGMPLPEGVKLWGWNLTDYVKPCPQCKGSGEVEYGAYETTALGDTDAPWELTRAGFESQDCYRCGGKGGGRTQYGRFIDGIDGGFYAASASMIASFTLDGLANLGNLVAMQDDHTVEVAVQGQSYIGRVAGITQHVDGRVEVDVRIEPPQAEFSVGIADVT